jgi:hypothetical protein
MESVERIEHRARVRYELGRLRRALLGFAPVSILVALAAIFAKKPTFTVAIGVAVFAVGAIFLWYGREVRRAVLPGVAAGIVPLVFALCANNIGHLCTGDRCMAVCIPACATGGLLAGVVVASLAVRRRSGIGVWVAASSVALLTGAMGCACVGYAGVAGLAVGFGTGLVAVLLGRLLRKNLHPPASG